MGSLGVVGVKEWWGLGGIEGLAVVVVRVVGYRVVGCMVMEVKG